MSAVIKSAVNIQDPDLRMQLKSFQLSFRAKDVVGLFMFVFFLTTKQEIDRFRIRTFDGPHLRQAPVGAQDTVKIHDTAEQISSKTTVRRNAAAVRIDSLKSLELAKA